MADMIDLKSIAEMHAGSNPVRGTERRKIMHDICAWIRKKKKEDEEYEKKQAEKMRLLLLSPKELAIEKMHLHRCSVKHYIAWLKRWLEAGNKPTHYYNYSISSAADSFYKAERNFTVIPLCGASAISIIVPKHIHWSSKLGTGHNDIYAYKNRPGFVPIYSDTLNMLGITCK